MQYLLLLHLDESGWDRMSPAEQTEAVKPYRAFTEALHAAGVYVGSNRLRASNLAKRVTVGSGARKVLDGPFAETKEQLGGYLLIDVPDEAAAIEWAAKCPTAEYGTVEVRAVWPREET